MRKLLRRLPWQVKAGLVSAAGCLGDWPLRILAGPGRGLVVYVPLSRWLQVAAATHEAHVAEVLCHHLKPAMVACDAGAHLGYFTVLMARRVGAEGRVASFEPSPRHAGLLRRTVLRNGLPQVTVVEQALGASVGTGWLDPAPNDAMSRVRPNPVEGRTIAVSLTTLDAWEASVGGLERLDLIKLDVEGQELAALAGAAGAVERHRPAIVCEVHWCRGIDYRPRLLVDWLIEAGYR